jgi:acyl-CoA thioesterase
MNYLDNIRAHGKAANPFFCMMGIDIEEIGNGNARLSLQVRPDMMNGEGWLQGGIFTALADEAMVLAIYSLLGQGESLATISESTTFLSGIQSGTLIAEGRVVRKGRRVAFAEAEVKSEGENPKILSRSQAAFAVSKN